jgi:hypothetical protein
MFKTPGRHTIAGDRNCDNSQGSGVIPHLRARAMRACSHPKLYPNWNPQKRQKFQNMQRNFALSLNDLEHIASQIYRGGETRCMVRSCL